MTNTAGGHIEGDQLEKYSMGAVSASTALAIDEHLLICESCRQNLVSTEAYVAAMRKAADELRTTPVTQKQPACGTSGKS